MFRFADLFAGVGGFHSALAHAGGSCVFASEIDPEARATYRRNWSPRGTDPYVLDGDITLSASKARMDVPEHDVLTAGFPCQPFSKSGRQLGMDEVRGTLFWNIGHVLEKRRPSVVLLENVRNLAGPRHRDEWETIIRTLREIGYSVSSTPSVVSPHLLPPELGGTPQARDRVFIVGTYVGAPRAMRETAVQPAVVRAPVQGWDPARWEIGWVLDDDKTVDNLDRYQISADERQWIRTWDDLVQAHRDTTGQHLPGFPLWSDFWCRGRPTEQELLAMPGWLERLIRKNLRFYDQNRGLIDGWRHAHPELTTFPATRRKLEWQAQGALTLWETIMQMRPSGIRAKAPSYAPALVAMTQIPIIGPRRRRLTPAEAARLQGLPPSFKFDNKSERASYKQLGNGVAVGAAWHVLRTHVEQDAAAAQPRIAPRVRDAVLEADPNPCPGVLRSRAYQVPPDRQAEQRMAALIGA